MTAIGRVAELWRYPVKSMQGERCASLEVGPYGIAGDRRFAFESADAPIGKPLLRSSERAAMLRSQARLDVIGTVTVLSAEGPIVPVNDPALPHHLGPATAASRLTLRQRDRPFTDVRPIALHSLATARAIAAASPAFDGRRLRSNLVLQLASSQPFAEDDLAGRVLQIGDAAQLTMLERIPRCRMVALHPETAAPDPSPLRWLAQNRNGRAGIYARMLKPGTIVVGDTIHLLD